MFKVKLICVLLLVAGLAGAALAQNASTIMDIQIKGVKTADESQVMDAIFNRIGDSVVAEKINSDTKAIYALGYFEDVSATMEAFNNGTRVIFKIKENPVISQILIDGNTVYSTKEILSLIKTKPFKVLNFNTLREDIQTINSLYQDNGYTLARVADVQTDEIYHTVTFKISEGIVEAITLNGNDQTQDYVILREFNTKPGQVFNQEILKKDLRRVFNLGFFSEVNPTFDPGSAQDRVVINLAVQETRSSTINFGGGFGEREGWFGFVDLSVNNLFGTGQGMMVRGQSGQEMTTYQFKYTNPWFLPERLGDHAALSLRRWYTIGRDIYLNDQSGVYNGFDISLARPFLEDFSIAYTLGSERVSPYSTATFEAYQSDTIGATISYDTRDVWLNPTKGMFYSVSLKQGWKYTTLVDNFFKITADANHFIPVTDNQVFAFHGGAGIGFGDIPIGEEFWAGGPNTVRGYYVSEAKRGTRKLIFNFEYRMFFTDMFQGVFFYDLGNAWYLGAPVPANFISGWGPGVRVNTPLGPIRLDWGVPTGKAFGEGIMHFSIGQAF